MSLFTIIYLCLYTYSVGVNVYNSLANKTSRYTWRTLTIGIPVNLALLVGLTTVGFTFTTAVLGLVSIGNIALLIGKYGTEVRPMDGAGEWFFYLLMLSGLVACVLTL